MARRLTSLLPNLAAVILLTVLPGCDRSKPSRLKTSGGRTLGHVVGWVTLDGKPLAGAQVDFHNDVTRTCSAGTDENGRYELKFNTKLKGAPVGEHRVAIGLFGSNSADPNDEPLPKFYNKKTILTATVREGPNTISFHLSTPQGASGVSELGEVRGLILLDGNPISGAKLVFQRDGQSVAEGISDPLGHYEMTFTEKRIGAAVGSNRITVSKTDKEGRELFRSVYNNQSTLKRNVEPGENQINFSLSTKDLPGQTQTATPTRTPAKGS